MADFSYDNRRKIAGTKNGMNIRQLTYFRGVVNHGSLAAADSTTPMAPESRGHYSQELKDAVTTNAWLARLQNMLSASGDVKSQSPLSARAVSQTRPPCLPDPQLRCSGSLPLRRMFLRVAEHRAGLHHGPGQIRPRVQVEPGRARSSGHHAERATSEVALVTPGFRKGKQAAPSGRGNSFFFEPKAAKLC